MNNVATTKYLSVGGKRLVNMDKVLEVRIHDDGVYEIHLDGGRAIEVPANDVGPLARYLENRTIVPA